MRWRPKQELIIYAVFVIDFILIYLVWYTNQDVSIWIGLLGVELAVTIPLLFKFLKAYPQYDKEKLKHSEDLIREVFEKPIVPASVFYDFDEIHQTHVEWAETNPLFDLAIQHLKHKKYKKTWQAYINGKKDAEIQINKIVKKIQKYREMVERHLDNTKLPLKVREKEYSHREGEYSKKLINHLIFYDIHKKIETDAINKKLELFPRDLKQMSDDSIFHLEWCDDNPYINGTVGGEIIATGDRTTMEYLQNVIGWIENDKELRELVLEIVSLKNALENNIELEIFEDGRQEIINQVKIIKDALAGKCKKCP